MLAGAVLCAAKAGEGRPALSEAEGMPLATAGGTPALRGGRGGDHEPYNFVGTHQHR